MALTITAIYNKVDGLKAKARELSDIHALIRIMEKDKAAGRAISKDYLENCKRREQKIIAEFEKIFEDK